MKKKILYVAAGLAGVVVLAVIAAFLLIDANSLRPAIESQLSNSLGRKVQVGDLGLSLFSGGVSARDISIADDPAFSHTPFLTAKSVDVSVELVPLILSRSVRLTALTLKEPELAMLRSSSGKWNFSSLGGGPRPDGTSAPAKLTIHSLRIVNGRVTVGSWRARDKPSAYEAVNLTASNVSFESQIPFSFAANTPGGGEVKVEGTAGPVNRADTAETPFSATINVQHLDVAATGFIDPASGLSGVLDYTGSLSSGGRKAHTEGTVKADKLRLTRSGGPAKSPVTIDYASDYDMVQQAGVISRGEIHTGKSTAHLSGNYNTQGQSTVVHMKLKGSALPLADIEGLLPALGVILPSGARLQGGTADADLAIEGAVDRLVTTGDLNVANARLTGFDLASKLSAVSALTGMKGNSDTMIQTFASNLRIAQEGIRADNLKLIVPAIGTMTGRGTIGTNNTLDFHMVATLLNPGQGSMLGQMTSGIPGLGQNAKGTVPFLIQGTTASPIFVPDVAGSLNSGLLTSMQPQQQTSGQQGLGNMLGGLLGKKK
ncbi:MAG TPA: AsmA family protein [Candidatus Saccharimonadales bacterium]|jgi:AsmA protein|nr:AsmA family protein [Candidatus Saccharimonadales bacterium]